MLNRSINSVMDIVVQGVIFEGSLSLFVHDDTIPRHGHYLLVRESVIHILKICIWPKVPVGFRADISRELVQFPIYPQQCFRVFLFWDDGHRSRDVEFTQSLGLAIQIFQNPGGRTRISRGEQVAVDPVKDEFVQKTYKRIYQRGGPNNTLYPTSRKVMVTILTTDNSPSPFLAKSELNYFTDY